MSSLYDHIRRLQQEREHLHLVRPGEDDPGGTVDATLTAPEELGDDANVSEDERREILEELNEIVEGNRLEVGTETFSFVPRRNGATLPILINAAALALVGTAAVAFSAFFNSAEEGITTGAAALESTEGLLLAQLRQETEAELAEKDQEIANAQNLLADLNRERDELIANFDERVAEREAEIRAQLDAELEAERARLRDQGVSVADIDAQLAALEQARSAELDQQLGALRASFDEQLAAEQARIEQLQRETEQQLAGVEAERAAVEAEQAAREQELRAEAESIEAERTEIGAELDRIQAERDREQLVNDQILSLYGSVNAQLRAADYQGARRTLRNLADYLDQAAIRSLATVAERKPVDDFIISSLGQLIDNEESVAQADTSSLLAAANILDSVTALTTDAGEAFAAGDVATARTSYEQAIDRVPTLAEALDRVQQIDSQLAFSERSAEVGELLARGDTAFVAGDYPAALTNYAQALQAFGTSPADAAGDGGQGPLDPAVVDRTVARIAEAGANTAGPPVVPAALAALDASDVQLEAGAVQDALAAYLQALSSFPAGSHVERGLGGVRAAVDALVADFDTQLVDAGGREQALAEQNQQLSEQNQQLADEAERLRESGDSDAVAAADRLAALEAERDAALAQVQQVQTQLDTTSGSLDDTRAELDIASAALETANSDLAAANAEIESAAASVAAAEADLATAQAELATASEREAALAEEVASLQQTLESGGGASLAPLDEARSELADARVAQAAAERAAQQAATDLAAAESTAAQAQRARTQLVQRVSGTRNRLSSLKDQIESQRASDDELLALLQTRLLIRRIIGSPAVSEANPGVYDAMDRYFDELAAEQRREGQAEILSQVGAQLKELLGN